MPCTHHYLGTQPARQLRLARAGSALLWLCGLIIALLWTASAHGVVQMRCAIDPVFVDVPAGSALELVRASADAQAKFVQKIAQQVQAGGSVANTLIAFRPQGFELSFDRLTDSDRQALERHFGDDHSAQSQYESAVAALLNAVITQSRAANKDLRISVVGLPIEDDDEANRRYAPVIKELSAFVTSHNFGKTEGGTDQAPSVNRYMPDSLELAAGRPIYYQDSSVWMVAIGGNRQDIVTTTGKSASTSKASGGKKSGKSGKSGAKSGGAHSAALPKGTFHVTSGVAGGSSAPQSTPTAFVRPKFYVNQTTSAVVKAIYSANHAKDAIIIYQAGFDADDNGAFDDVAFFTSQVNLYVPVTYTGPVCLDWEGAGINGLMTPPGSALHGQTVNQFITLIKKAKQLRPNAKWGFYGLPIGRYWNRNAEWKAMATALQPILDESQCLFPSLYDTYKTGEAPEQNPAMDLEVVRDNVKLALMHADGKPVYGYVHHRYHPSNAVWGYHLIDDDEFNDQVRAVFDAQYQGNKAAGIVWWGADQFYRALSLENLSPSHPDYAESQRLKLIFADEIPEGVSDQAHWDTIDKHIVQLLSSVLDNVQ